MANHVKLTDAKIETFLEFFTCTANVSVAARMVGVSRQALYLRRSRDVGFARRWDEAYEQGTDVLEDEAVRRIVEGVEEPIFYQGSQCGTVRKFSDTLLMFLLKARRPEKFKEKADAVTRDGAGNIPIIQVQIAGDTYECSNSVVSA